MPILIPVSVILRFTGENEIFYYQERIGKDSRKFKLLKFATMLKNSPNMSTGTVTVKNDPRVLPVGRFLRKTKINELPQLINIFLGDMSVIGPRPLTIQTFESYSSEVQKSVVSVRPGLSGVGSIIFRAEEDILSGEYGTVDYYNSVIAPYKGSLEVWYVKNRSLRIYFSAILITVWSVCFPSTNIIWKIFKELPPPPDNLKSALNYIN